MISDEELGKRQEAVDFARASVALEGFVTTDDDEAHARQFIEGRLTLKDFIHSPVGPMVSAGSDTDRLETLYTFRRVVELELNPVTGAFNASHLREINRRIFQDLPAVGLTDVTPGIYRPPVPDGNDWIKTRVLSTVDGQFFVAYSPMDQAAQAQLDDVLATASPVSLRGLGLQEAIARLAETYVALDYIHPFRDGNSRTLRTFTKQLAGEAGYALDWVRFGRGRAGRDILYIARDLSVNRRAKAHIRHEQTLTGVVYTLDRLGGNRDLPDLLRDAIERHARPNV